MRFLEHGPALPDRLLNARDEGQVIFFCGAGVSRARAGLPDFYGLAHRVVDLLGSTSDSPARRLIEAAASQIKITGVGGLTPADRVFALLEREFEVSDVRQAVARALKPSNAVDLSAHQFILDLAQGPDGRVRLVTTNFDLLFESCNGSVPVHVPPTLPDPGRAHDFTGIVHLHGRVNVGYNDVFGEEFVLSSADFGRAYLADGWATTFIREMLELYQIVFIGYAADDPPVQYLLEALSDRTKARAGLYAFQAGDPSEAQALWGSRGVEAIPYDDADGHKALWETLGAWAERARDPVEWCSRVADRAVNSPAALRSFERGQVKHLVSNVPGARRFSSSAAPAEWLCVFDPMVRYGPPSSSRQGEPAFDPFEAYGLDDDEVPALTDPENPYAKRDMPQSAWDGLTPSRQDRLDFSERDISGLRGSSSAGATRLPARLWHLGAWLANVADQPAAVWWAAGQAGLHPDIQDHVRRRFDREPSAPTEIEKAWRVLLRSWADRQGETRRDRYDLATEISRVGWSIQAIRACGQIRRPRLATYRPYGWHSRPPQSPELKFHELVRVEVEYTSRPEDQVPDCFLARAVAEARRGLELGVDLELEAAGFECFTLPPINRDPDVAGEGFDRVHGIAAPFFSYIELFRRLMVVDREAARREYAAWRNGDSVFSRLKIFAAGEPSLLSPIEAGKLLRHLDDEAFWGDRHQRDFLLILAARWLELPLASRAGIEKRILRGRPRWQGEKAETYRQRRAYSSLQRITWLEKHGCQLSLDLSAAKAALQIKAQNWKDEYAASAAASLEGRSGYVAHNTDASSLIDVSPGMVLRAAAALPRHEPMSLIEYRPLEGLAKLRPAKMLRALVLTSHREDFPEWGWYTLITSESRESDRPRLYRQIAERLARLKTADLARVLYSATMWLEGVSVRLAGDTPVIFDHIWTAMMEAARAHPEAAGSAIRSGSSDWSMSSINSPAGRLARVLMEHPARQPVADEGFQAAWLSKATQLLDLPQDARRHAAVTFLYNLHWFFYHDRRWTEDHLLSLLDGDEADREAFWTGFFSNASAHGLSLFVRLRKDMLRLARHSDNQRWLGHLAGSLLAGWGSFETDSSSRCVTDTELRDVLVAGSEEFRSQILWYLRRWYEQDARDWRQQALVLLQTVWPRQKAAKSSKVSAGLMELAVHSDESFPLFADAVVPFLTMLTSDAYAILAIDRSESDLIARWPAVVLKLLYAVLSERASEWPYGADELVSQLMQQAEIAEDERLADLRQRLAAR